MKALNFKSGASARRAARSLAATKGRVMFVIDWRQQGLTVQDRPPLLRTPTTRVTQVTPEGEELIG
jgi:hypothetical protein